MAACLRKTGGASEVSRLTRVPLQREFGWRNAAGVFFPTASQTVGQLNVQSTVTGGLGYDTLYSHVFVF